MLTADIVTPVESPWTSTIVLATKKDGSSRFCIDYRKVNAVMKREGWPLPLIDEIFDEVKGSTVFTTLELFQGYWQIKMHESCKEMTNFICRYGTFQSEVMPFGLKNSGATFQRMMDNLLANVSNVKFYVDDVVVHSAAMEEHTENLEKVISLLRMHDLRVILSKCFAIQTKVQLLDYAIDSYGAHADEDKVQKIGGAQAPDDAKELRSFLSLATYCRRFIKGFAKIETPLSEKTSEKVNFEWTSEISLHLCSHILTSRSHSSLQPMLRREELAQCCRKKMRTDGSTPSIHYASRGLNDAGKNCSTYEREGLAIVFALNNFRHYLMCQKFKLFTGHEALKYVISTKGPHGRIARWMSVFAEYDFEVYNRPRPGSANADCLSRSSLR